MTPLSCLSPQVTHNIVEGLQRSRRARVVLQAEGGRGPRDSARDLGGLDPPHPVRAVQWIGEAEGHGEVLGLGAGAGVQVHVLAHGGAAEGRGQVAAQLVDAHDPAAGALGVVVEVGRVDGEAEKVQPVRRVRG